MATLPEGMKVLAVTPVNFDEIIELSEKYNTPDLPPYTEEKLRSIRTMAREKNNVAFVMFMDQTFWHQTEEPGKAIHDTGDWRGDR